MWRRKKFIIIAVLAGVLLVGSIGGVALAQTENGDDSQNVTCREALLGEACEILINEWGCSEDITAADLGDVLERARQAVGDECQRPKRFGGPRELGACREAFIQAVCDYLNSLDGMDIQITLEQLEAAFADARSQMPDECQPLGKGKGYRPGPCGFCGMAGMRGFGGPFAPAE